MTTASLALVLVTIASTAGLAACKKESPKAVPQPVGIESARCGDTSPCNPGLVCSPASSTCVKPDHPEMLAVKKAEREREAAYLAQSGVAPSTQVEREPAPATTGSGAVRVVRTKNNGETTWVFAACRDDERLVGGGCTPGEGQWVAAPAYLSGDTANDTVGARWNCGWKNPQATKAHIEAFALCQRI